MKFKGLPFNHIATGAWGFTIPGFRSSGLPQTLESRGELPLSPVAGKSWETQCGWRWGRRLGKGSNMGTAINKKSSPHDFLYLVPVASLQAP